MNAKMIWGRVGSTLKKYSPEILMGVGITGVLGSTVLACRATLKCEDVLDTHAEKMEKVEKTIELAEAGELHEEYTAEDAKKDRTVITVQTGLEFVKLYGPAVTLMGASIGCILGAHRIMSKRNVALMAAYKVVEEAFSEYRKRVVDELGEAKDAHFRYGTDTVEETETVIDPETGKKKKVKKESEEFNGANVTGFARVFKEDVPDQHGSWDGSTQWCKVHDYNLEFLTRKEQYFNDQLVAKGIVTINDVYAELGFPPTESGMVSGWKYKSERGDGYISFQPRGIDGNWAYGKDGDPIILDFNIDGMIFDSNVARNEW